MVSLPVLVIGLLCADFGRVVSAQDNSIFTSLTKLPKLSSNVQRDIEVCTKILSKNAANDDKTWYNYFSCVENKLYLNKVVSHCLTKNQRKKRFCFYYP